MNLGAVLLTGLFAGGISCAAVQGGLLAGLVTRQRGLDPPGPRGSGKAAAGRTRRPPSSGKASAARTRQRDRAIGKRTGPRGPGRTVAAPTPLPARALAGLRTLRAQAGDDLAPVGAFLAGKLASHTILGGLLGAVGAAVQLAPAVRVWTQLAAGVLIMVFGLAQLGVGPFKRLTIEPPATWSRFVRGRARSQAAFAPAALGFATVLIPCGVTLSVETLALTSGSAWSGAAVMAVFVVGTSPLFAVLGYAARRAATAWRGRLAVATGLVVLAMGVYTFNGGLTLAGSPLAARNLPQTLGLSVGPPVADPSVVSVDGDGRQEVIVTARTGSYRPGNIAVRAGVPTTLVVRSEQVDGCVRAFVIPKLNRQWTLPENGDTRIDLGILAPGRLKYSCAMGMYGGQLTVTDQQGS